MSMIFYLYRKTFKNRVKRALKKPVTYIYAAFVILYFYFIFRSFPVFFELFEVEGGSVLAAILTVIVFIFIPSNMISYSKRKGLIFREPDIHFLFSSPVSPKKILLYAHIKNMIVTLILNIIVVVASILWFDIPIWKMAVYFAFSFIVENILEGSIMILCYGNEKLDKKQMFAVQIAMYLLVGIFILIGVMA